MKKAKNIIKVFVYKMILRFKDIKDENTLVLFSDQRNGSTWLMETLRKCIDKSVVNWEPLQEDNRVTQIKFNFSWKPILRTNHKDDEIVEFFKNIHRFKHLNSWTVSQNTYSEILKCKFVITKYVKANLLVPFLLNNIEFINQPIFLIRHPIDTCLSQINHFSNNKSKIKNIKEVNLFISEYYSEIKLLNENNVYDDLEIQLINWCINNCYTINKLNELTIKVIYYSDLLINPKKEISDLLSSINSSLIINDHIYSKSNLRTPSFTTDHEYFKKDPKAQLNKNINKLDKAMKDRIQSIFDHFDFKLYSAYSSLPNKEILNDK